jgi:hypothetical protein
VGGYSPVSSKGRRLFALRRNIRMWTFQLYDSVGMRRARVLVPAGRALQ